MQRGTTKKHVCQAKGQRKKEKKSYCKHSLHEQCVVHVLHSVGRDVLALTAVHVPLQDGGVEVVLHRLGSHVALETVQTLQSCCVDTHRVHDTHCCQSCVTPVIVSLCVAMGLSLYIVLCKY